MWEIRALRTTPTLALTLAALTLVALALSGGCASAEEIFVGSRIENLCNDALPVCGERAGCVLIESEHIRGSFPGGQRIIVRTPNDRSALRVRLFLVDQVFPGTELLVRAANTGCDGFDESLRRDIDLFEAAGDAQTLEETLEVTGRGDHLVEVFSDMATGFLMTVDVEDI